MTNSAWTHDEAASTIREAIKVLDDECYYTCRLLLEAARDMLEGNVMQPEVADLVAPGRDGHDY